MSFMNPGRQGCACRRQCSPVKSCRCNVVAGANTCADCKISPTSGCRENSDCRWFPISDMTRDEREMNLCCDQDGCCGMFPADCRNTFWPSFSHPRWLCCKDLYCARNKKPCC